MGGCGGQRERGNAGAGARPGGRARGCDNVWTAAQIVAATRATRGGRWPSHSGEHTAEAGDAEDAAARRPTLRRRSCVDMTTSGAGARPRPGSMAAMRASQPARVSCKTLDARVLPAAAGAAQRQRGVASRCLRCSCGSGRGTCCSATRRLRGGYGGRCCFGGSGAGQRASRAPTETECVMRE